MSFDHLPKDNQAQPGTPPVFSSELQQNKDTPISTGNETTNTNTDFSLRHKHNINITSKVEEKRDSPSYSSGNRGYRSTIWVDRDSWKQFVLVCRGLGYSASELINTFISSIINNTEVNTQLRAPLSFNVAIAKAESKSVINMSEYVARKELDALLEKVKALKARAERECQERDIPLSFTIEQSKVLEDSIKKALKSLRSLDSEKLQEVEAALSILKSIREGKP